MPDPFSVATGICGLISFTSFVARTLFDVYKYGQKVHRAPESALKTREALSQLRRVLLDLEDLYTNTTEDLPHIENILDEIQLCTHSLECFQRSLDPKVFGFKQALERLFTPLKEDYIAEFITEINTHRSRFESARANDGILLISTNLKLTRQIASQSQDHEFQVILSWLSPLVFSDKQKELHRNRRQPGTSLWILRAEKYIVWRNATSVARLWCTGNPGVGKSILW